MTNHFIKQIQYQHRVGSHNIHHHPQQTGVMFPLIIALAAFSALSMIL
ncbi:hypothetical protein [Dickeya chrysanthemi]